VDAGREIVVSVEPLLSVEGVLSGRVAGGELGDVEAVGLLLLVEFLLAGPGDVA
jgi:hypothetical protein